MEITLPPDLERQVADKLKSGQYGSASDLVRAALRQFFSAEDEHRRDLARLDRMIAEGIESAERDPLLSGEESKQRLRERLDAARPAR